ncbi:MAG: protein-disulfide reductase DsbD family protein [Lysobacteraceae bacterium]
MTAPLLRRLSRFLRATLIALPLVVSSIAAPAWAIDPDDLLPVDQAYVLSAEAAGPDSVRVRWKIADGYYLYRHRTSVAAVSPGATAGALRLPKGEPHEDEFFGKTETYRGDLVATLPNIAGAAGTVTVKVKYQGCADAGLCYPPQTRMLTVALPGAAATDDGPSGFNPLARGAGPGGSLLAGGKAAPLPEEQAFAFDAIVGDGNTLLLRFSPAPGYYLYRDKTRVRLEADGIAAGKLQWPPGQTHRDEHFGDVIVYFQPVDVPLPLVRTTAEARTVTVKATFQGCQNDGICYPPMTRSVRVALPRGQVRTTAAVEAAAAATTAATDTTTPSASTSPQAATAATTDTTPAPAVAPQDAARVPGSDAGPTLFGLRPNLALALLAALLGGLILNLMPCVLPVLSIKVLGLVESGESAQRRRAHALWYTAGVLASFGALGALAMALRQAGTALGWGFQLQQPLVVAALGLLMFVFGLSLSGVWQVGGRWIGAGHGLASRSGAIGDFFTGVLAVVVAAPCTAPLMGPALGWAFAASTGLALMVFLALGLGLALPFLLVGFVPALARWLPRPGAWMDTFKRVLAFPLYLTALWLAWVLGNQRGPDAMAWWGLAALALAFAAWAWTHATMHGTRAGRNAPVLAIVATLWPLQAIRTLPATAFASAASTHDDGRVAYSAQRLADLRKAGRVVFVNMTADWCVTCKVNEKAVFSRDGFREALAKSDAVYMVGDWTDVDPGITAFLQRYKAVGVPLYVVFPRGGGEGTVLPTVLTPGMTEDALAKAAGR